jgi:hypothetical protein
MTETSRPARQARQQDAAVITSAEMSYEEQLRLRKRRYVLTMGMRFPLIIAGAACYSIPWLAITLIALSVPLPWCAVLIANDRPAKKTRKVVAGTINHERALPAGNREIVDG